jgi:hypothetical protein
VGCGKNNDLTYDGATKWANALPAGITKDVFYYTTQYKDGTVPAVWGGGGAVVRVLTGNMLPCARSPVRRLLCVRRFAGALLAQRRHHGGG